MLGRRIALPVFVLALLGMFAPAVMATNDARMLEQSMSEPTAQALSPPAGKQVLMRLVRDESGQVKRIESSDGNNLEFFYGADGFPNLIKTRAGFVPVSKSRARQPGVPGWFEIMGAQPLNQQSGFDSQHSVNGKAPSLSSVASYVGDDGCQDGNWCNLQQSWIQCQSDLNCSVGLEGFWSSLISALGAYATDGSAFFAGIAGSLYGLTMEALTAGLSALANVGLAADIIAVYGLAGVGVGIVFIGGYVFGTFLYNQYGDIIWRSW